MGVRELKKGLKFYFIGVCGISMSGLAMYLLGRGCKVSGSDLNGGEMVERLRLAGAEITVGERVSFSAIDGCDVVIYTDAIPLENKELCYAKAQGKEVLSRAELLKRVCAEFRSVLAVAGSHGKTTCTSMCAHVLQAARVPFCAHIGGEDCQFGNFYDGGNEYFVTEACEYKKNLLKVPADTVILLNVDKDHLECYDGEEDLRNTFTAFCATAKTAVACLDDACGASISGAVTFSIYEKKADYRATYLRSDAERYSFTVREYGIPVCRIHLKVVGRCNVYNALAAFAAMRTYGFSVEEIKRGLESFVGVKRRFEIIGRYRGAAAICDYAHHPKEIASTVQTAKRLARQRLFVVFQPHTYSRTKNLFPEFVSTLKEIDRLMIYKTFPARERLDEQGDGKTLAEKVGCLYGDSLSALRAWLDRTVSEGDVVLFLGAGDVYHLAKYLVKN